MVYGEPCAVNTDPVEKKPLYHFMPGSKTFSVGTAGCNLACKNCQNASISQVTPDEVPHYNLSPEKLVDMAERQGSKIIAYTYTEPVTFIEYVYDTATIARKRGIKNVIVTAGYINKAPLLDLVPVIDAANIDLKSFDDNVYKDLNAGRLSVILRTIEILKEQGVWLELTYLIVPQWSDDEQMIRNMCRWMVDNGMQDVPLHFSRFFPTYQLIHLPPTPEKVMQRAWQIAAEEGLHYVFLGNMPATGKEHSFCPSCGKPVIRRGGFAVKENVMSGGKCLHCGEAIAGVWS